MQVMLFNVDDLETEGTVRPVEAEAVKSFVALEGLFYMKNFLSSL